MFIALIKDNGQINIVITCPANFDTIFMFQKYLEEKLLKKQMTDEDISNIGYNIIHITFEEITDEEERDFFENLPQTEEQADILKEKALAYPLYRNSYITPNGDSMIMVIKTQAVSALTDDGSKIKNHGMGVVDQEASSGDKVVKSISQVENIAIGKFGHQHHVRAVERLTV